MNPASLSPAWMFALGLIALLLVWRALSGQIARAGAAQRAQFDTQRDALREDRAHDAQAHAERDHAAQAAIAALRQDVAAFAAQQLRQNHEALMGALAGIVADFDERINGQYQRQLAQLGELAAAGAQLQEKHRVQTMEMMHHARRSAGQMERTCAAFATLLEQGAVLAAIGEQVNAVLALAGPRQDAIDAGLAQLAAAVQRAHADIAAVQAGLDEAVVDYAAGAKRAVDGINQRAVQNAGELQLAVQALNKPLLALGKQLTGLSAKLATDVAPMAQQLRRVADMSKGGR